MPYCKNVFGRMFLTTRSLIKIVATSLNKALFSDAPSEARAVTTNPNRAKAEIILLTLKYKCLALNVFTPHLAAMRPKDLLCHHDEK